jgi:hypothetical protein
LFVAATLAFPPALIALGDGRTRVRAVVAIALAIVLEGSGLVLLAFAEAPPGITIAGWPVTAWLMLVGVAVVPFVLTAVGHAVAARSRGGHRGAPPA